MPELPPFDELLKNLSRDKIKDAMQDPVGTLTTMNSVIELSWKLLPVLPHEYALPIPRVLYDKLRGAQQR